LHERSPTVVESKTMRRRGGQMRVDRIADSHAHRDTVENDNPAWLQPLILAAPMTQGDRWSTTRTEKVFAGTDTRRPGPSFHQRFTYEPI